MASINQAVLPTLEGIDTTHDLPDHVKQMQPMLVRYYIIQILQAANVGALLHSRKLAGLFGPPEAILLYIE